MFQKVFLNSITILFIFLNKPGLSQDNPREVHSGNQQWIQYYNRLKLSQKFTLVSDGGFRWKSTFKNYSLAIIRTGLMYELRKNLFLSGGIASTVSYNNNKINKSELRGWQEVLFQSQIKLFYISNRVRIEERYFKNVSDRKFANGDSFNFRFRYRFYISIPLNNSTVKEKTISVNFGDEIFINFGKEIVYNTFDNNRIIAGLSYQLNKKQSLSINYVKQFSRTTAVNSLENNDVLWLSFIHNMSLKNKKG